MKNMVRGTAQGPPFSHVPASVTFSASLNPQRNLDLQEGLTKCVSFLEMHTM